MVSLLHACNHWLVIMLVPRYYVSFSQGGISQLKLDCIVLPINEMTLTKSPLSAEVHRAAGNDLLKYYNDLKGFTC